MSVSVREPAVLPPYWARRALAYPVSALLSVSNRLGSKYTLPPSVRVLVTLLLLINWSNLPLLWHIRMFYEFYRFRKQAFPRRKLIGATSGASETLTAPGVVPRLRLSQLPLGKDFMEDVTKLRFKAWPADCDWNMHLSNSSYNRLLDFVRMGHIARTFVRVASDGGRIALGGAAYTYHREVPIFASFEIKVHLAGWDQKWLYLVAQFVSPEKPQSIARSKSAQNLKRLAKDALAGPRASLDEGAASEAAKAKDHRASSSQPTLYCTAISRYCIKDRNRRTIPPWIVAATSGYGTFASTRTNWEKAESLRKSMLQAATRRNGGKPLSTDNFFLGSGPSKHGILARFHECAERGEEWTKPQAWEMSELDNRCRTHLSALQGLSAKIDF